MVVPVFLSLLFLICKVHSQFYGPGSNFPGPWSLDPCLGQNIDFNVIEPCGVPPNFPISQNIGLPRFNQLNLPQPCIQNQIPPCQLNLPSTPCIQNQIQPCQLNLPSQPCIQNQPCQLNLPTQTPCQVNLPQSFIPNQIPPCQVTPPFINPAPTIPQIFPSLPLTSPIITNPVPQVTTPVVATTIVDNTLANSLANAIQLLIVSNLIENTLGSSSSNALAQLGLLGLDSPCINNYEVVTPDFSCQACDYPVIDYNPCFSEIPCYQEQLFQPSFIDSCVSNFGAGYGSFPVCDSPTSFRLDSCGINPGFGIDGTSNLFGSVPVLPSFGCVEPVSVAPVALEVPFPAAIPAQLVCNFGYMPTNTPCVSVNVEPLPFDGCSNFIGNFGAGSYF